MEDPQRQAHHLQILAARRRRDVSRLCSHVEDDGFLQPRNKEMGAFFDNFFFDSRKTVEDYCPGPTAHIVDRTVISPAHNNALVPLGASKEDGRWNRQPRAIVENALHCKVTSVEVWRIRSVQD
jgi:hypothetical protein